MLSHRNPSERICNGTDEDNRSKERAEEADLESGAPERAKPAAAPVSDQVSMLDMQSDELRRALESITART